MSNSTKPVKDSPVIATTVVTKAGESLHLNQDKAVALKDKPVSNTTESFEELKKEVIATPSKTEADKALIKDQAAKQKILDEVKAQSEAKSQSKLDELLAQKEKNKSSDDKEDNKEDNKDDNITKSDTTADKAPTASTKPDDKDADKDAKDKDTAAKDTSAQDGNAAHASNAANAQVTDPKNTAAAKNTAAKETDADAHDTAAKNSDAKNPQTVASSKVDEKSSDADVNNTITPDSIAASSLIADKADNAGNASKEQAKGQAPLASPSTTTTPSADASLPRRVAILGGNRIPFARSNSSYADVSNIDMLSAALNGLVERYELQGERVGEVVAGAVLKLSRDLNLTREAALNTALDPQTPAYDISQACGTGLQTTFAAANKIALGIIDSAITGGVDTTSDAPIAIGDGLRKALIKLGAAKNNKQRLAALTRINPKKLIDAPQNGEPRTGLSMGEHQAITTLEWNISREAQDELAVSSHKNLARAYDEGFFDDLITPFKGLTRDNNLRPDSTLKQLAKLKPAFGKRNANPTMTAANSTPLTDGASCVLLGTDAWAQAHGLKALAYITHQETAAVDFIGKEGPKEGLLMAPAYAVPRMLARAGLTLQDFDFYEIHEAFASQVLSTLAAWEDETFCKERLELDAPLGSIDRSKLNVNGSSLAAGHPFAATGGRILATAAKLLDQKGSGRALISICAAGGQGVTCILEK